MTHPSLPHLHEHHGDFEAFCQLMAKTAEGRFGPLWWGTWAQYVAPAVGETGTVVDLGCGPGGLFASLRQHHPAARIIGVEVQPAMLRAAQPLAKTLNVEVLEADLLEPLPLPDDSAHALVAAMVLHEMENPLPLIAEAARVLRPGGVWLIYDWVKQPLRHYLAGEVPTAERIAHFREHCLYTPDDLAFLCENAGLQVLEIIGRRGGDYAMLAVQKPLGV
jgi:ubiquinone/menaquinone biosynthesis C-methylase UbiE